MGSIVLAPPCWHAPFCVKPTCSALDVFLSAIKAHKESLKGEGAAPEFQGIDEANCLAVGNMLVNRGFVRPEL